MKKLFLSILLVLTVSFAFASNEVEKVSTFDVVETLELTNSVELANTDFVMEINDISLLDVNNLDVVVDAAPGDLWLVCVYLGDGWWYCEIYVEQ